MKKWGKNVLKKSFVGGPEVVERSASFCGADSNLLETTIERVNEALSGGEMLCDK